MSYRACFKATATSLAAVAATTAALLMSPGVHAQARALDPTPPEEPAPSVRERTAPEVVDPQSTWPFHLTMVSTGVLVTGSAIMIGLSQVERDGFEDMARETPLLYRHGCRNGSNMAACDRYFAAAVTVNQTSEILLAAGLATSLASLGMVGISVLGFAFSPKRAVTVAPTAGGLTVRGTF